MIGPSNNDYVSPEKYSRLDDPGTLHQREGLELDMREDDVHLSSFLGHPPSEAPAYF